MNFAHRPTANEQGNGFGVPFSSNHDFVAGTIRLVAQRGGREASPHRGPFRDPFSDYDIPQIAGIVAPEHYDAFLLHGWRVRSDWQALRACRCASIPSSCPWRSQLRTTLPKRVAKRLLYDAGCSGIRRLPSVGQRNEPISGTTARGASSDRRTSWTPNVRRRGCTTAAADALRGAGDVAPGVLVVSFVGKLLPTKRPQDLIRALPTSRTACTPS